MAVRSKLVWDYDGKPKKSGQGDGKNTKYLLSARRGVSYTYLKNFDNGVLILYKQVNQDPTKDFKRLQFDGKFPKMKSV